MKKILALLLVVVMIFGLVACGATEEAPAAKAEETKTEEKKEESKEEASEEASEKKDSWLCDEKTTLTVFTYDRVNNTYEIPSNDLEFWQFLEDYTNVHIEWEITPWVGFEEVISTKLASGTDLADIVMVKDVAVGNNAGKNGLFLNLGDYWDTCFTKTEEYYKSIGYDYKAMFGNADGSLYYIDGTVEPVEGHITFMYNTEWMEKLGLEVPTTLDEFTAVMKAMKEAGDLNGNGDDDEVILTSSGLTHVIDLVGSAFGIEQYEGWPAVVADENGIVTDEFTADNMKECLTYLNGLYEEGILDPEIGSMSMDALSEKVAADRVGCFIFYSAFAINYGQLTTKGQADPSAECYTLGFGLGNGEEEGYLMLRDIIDNTSAGININCENKELACKWLDTLLSDPEVVKVRTRGFEGEDWVDNGDGTWTKLTDENGIPVDIQKKGCGQIAMPHFQNADSFDFSGFPWYVEQYNVIRDSKWKAGSVTHVATYTDEEQELLDMVATDISSYWSEMREKFVKGDVDIESGWADFVDTMGKLGLEDYVKVYQSVYDRTTK